MDINELREMYTMVLDTIQAEYNLFNSRVLDSDADPQELVDETLDEFNEKVKRAIADKFGDKAKKIFLKQLNNY